MWQKVLQTMSGGGSSDINIQTFEFDNTVNVATSNPYTFEYVGNALFVVIYGEAYTATGNRAETYDNALVWYKGIPTKALAKYGANYGASTVPTATAGNNPTIYIWDGNRVTFKTSSATNYARCKFTVTVYSE